MTEPPPPWARPDPAAAPTPPPTVPVRPESAPEPTPEPEPPPLFPTQASAGDPMLFPGGTARRRARQDPPDTPRTERRARVGGTAVPPAPSGAAPPPGRRPPPPPTTSAQDAAVPAADPHLGVLAGLAEQNRSRRSYPGFVVLIVAAVLVVATVLGRSLVGGVPVALVIVPIALVAAVALAQRLTRGGTDLSVPVHNFRLQPTDGRTGYFIIDGEIDPNSLKSGDLVRVHGRGERDGRTVARSVDILATLNGPVVRQVTGREPTAVFAARVLSWISIALAVLLVALAATVIAG
jgi:hypothetical protein